MSPLKVLKVRAIKGFVTRTAVSTALFYYLFIVFYHGSEKIPNTSTVPDLIRYWGYPVEEHFVQTEDGYILGLHRFKIDQLLPFSKMKTVHWKKC